MTDAPDALLKYWDTTYPGVPIVPHRLRIAYGDRWLRIHSLPLGKRYAASQDEYAEILSRQNTVIDDLIGAERRYELVFGYFGEERDLPRAVTTALNGLHPVPLTTLSPEHSDKKKAFPLFVASLTWTTSQLDVVLRAVADDVLETPLLVGVKQGCLIAPYDGGMDIFVADESERDELRKRYAVWLPARSSGL